MGALITPLLGALLLLFSALIVKDPELQIGAEKYDAFIAKYFWLDEGKYVAHAAPASVLLQYATEEDFLTRDRVEDYYEI